MQPLKRELGLFGAIMLGLGSMVGTGVFVSTALAWSSAGAWAAPAAIVAGLLAACNALSSAQLAAAHPVAGGTYEYGYRLLTPTLGFIAGWMFLCAKSASAASAGLGFASYLDLTAPPPVVAVIAIALLTTLVYMGIRRISAVNTVLVAVTIIPLVIMLILAAPTAWANRDRLALHMPNPAQWHDAANAAALLFVAYTGYGRIATLGEEVKNPKRTIPFAIITTIGISIILYTAVTVAGICIVGNIESVNRTSPLVAIMTGSGHPRLAWVIRAIALTAMLGVLLNLVLGLSRVLLAMGRRNDMPARTADPRVATIVMGVVIALIALVGNIKTTWSFSAFTVLVYYALTNLAALKLSAEHRRYPRWIAAIGLVGCLSLAFMVQPHVYMTGLALIVVGLAWKLTRPVRSDVASDPPAE